MGEETRPVQIMFPESVYQEIKEEADKRIILFLALFDICDCS